MDCQKKIDDNKLLDISAIVVNCNEVHLLRSCLDSVFFCKEIILVDLDSDARCLAIADEYGARYIVLPPSPIVEIVHCEVKNIANHRWLLLIDPDEVITNALAISIQYLFLDMHDNIGAIEVPWKFYFAGKELVGTRWGGVKYKTILFHRDKVIFRPVVHDGRTLHSGFNRVTVQDEKHNHLVHNWVYSFKDFVVKHKRYLKREGERKFLRGHDYTPYLHVKSLFTSFYDSFVLNRGYKDGKIGLGLSVLWAWYSFKSWSSLRKYEKKT